MQKKGILRACKVTYFQGHQKYLFYSGVDLILKAIFQDKHSAGSISCIRMMSKI